MNDTKWTTLVHIQMKIRCTYKMDAVERISFARVKLRAGWPSCTVFLRHKKHACTCTRHTVQAPKLSTVRRRIGVSVENELESVSS